MMRGATGMARGVVLHAVSECITFSFSRTVLRAPCRVSCPFKVHPCPQLQAQLPPERLGLRVCHSQRPAPHQLSPRKPVPRRRTQQVPEIIVRQCHTSHRPRACCARHGDSGVGIAFSGMSGFVRVLLGVTAACECTCSTRTCCTSGSDQFLAFCDGVDASTTSSGTAGDANLLRSNNVLVAVVAVTGSLSVGLLTWMVVRTRSMGM